MEGHLPPPPKLHVWLYKFLSKSIKHYLTDVMLIVFCGTAT